MALQAGLFSAALTAFVVDSKGNLQPSPADETVYYLQQHSTILSQISVQLSSIAPQVSIPSTPPPPFPAFNPSASDVRVNIFWFMALAFSLVAALLAILVQQWVRDYMHVYQRYGDPLKSARLRQYLYEGCEGWYMPMVAEAVPAFLHISLFLFFAGLADSLLDINIKVALITIVPIGITGLLYTLTTFAPIIHPQSPYQNSFSGIFWYLFQKSHGWRFRYRGSDGEMKSVSTDMAQAQMQLAMEETVARNSRDVRAIRWLIDNLTEDAEMEKFLFALPGSFNTDWGAQVWRRVGEHQENQDQSQNETVARLHRDTAAHQSSSSWSILSILAPIIHMVRKPAHHPITPATSCSPGPHPLNVHPHSAILNIQGGNVVHELGIRVARSVEICKNRKLFSNNDLWQKRTRACIEATASLVCCANAKLAWFGGISELLSGFGNIRELSSAGTDELFVMRWTCLSLVAIRWLLEDDSHVRAHATRAMALIAEESDAGYHDALAGAQRIDRTLQRAKGCLFWLYGALHEREELKEDEFQSILNDNEFQIAELEQINIEADRLEQVDFGLFMTQNAINFYSHQITSQIPGVLDDLDWALIPFSRFVELEMFHNPRKQQFIRPGQTLKNICSPATTLRSILDGEWDYYPIANELLKNLENFRLLSGWQGDEMQRQLWRLQDLHDGSGLGFAVELFFLALSQLLSTSSSEESHSALFTGTFRAITSDWSKHKHSVGTQNILLDIAMSRREDFDVHYPAYIVDEFLLLLGRILEGQTGPHIDKAGHQFESLRWSGPRSFRDKVLAVLTVTGEQALPLAS